MTVQPQSAVLDDDKFYLEQIEDTFDEKHIGNCLYFNDPYEFVKFVKKDIYIYVVDYRLKDDLDGIHITRRIISINPHALVIMLTMNEDVDVTWEFKKAGGWQYVNKAHQKESIEEAAEFVKQAQYLIKELVREEQIHADKDKFKADTISWIRKHL